MNRVWWILTWYRYITEDFSLMNYFYTKSSLGKSKPISLSMFQSTFPIDQQDMHPFFICKQLLLTSNFIHWFWDSSANIMNFFRELTYLEIHYQESNKKLHNLYHKKCGIISDNIAQFLIFNNLINLKIFSM